MVIKLLKKITIFTADKLRGSVPDDLTGDITVKGTHGAYITPYSIDKE